MTLHDVLCSCGNQAAKEAAQAKSQVEALTKAKADAEKARDDLAKARDELNKAKEELEKKAAKLQADVTAMQTKLASSAPQDRLQVGMGGAHRWSLFCFPVSS